MCIVIFKTYNSLSKVNRFFLTTEKVGSYNGMGFMSNVLGELRDQNLIDYGAG